MDAKEAADAARNHITDALPGLDPAQLGLEEITLDPARREWRVTLSFTPPWEQQGQQNANAPRSYKEIIISDADGSVISMTDRMPCAPNSACTERSRSCSCTSGSWCYSARSLWMAFAVIPGVTVGWTTGILAFFKAMLGERTIDDTIVLMVYVVGMFVGLVTVGLRYQRYPSNKGCGGSSGKCCRCKPAGS